MTLDSLLKLAKFVDEQIHKQYEKLGNKLDNKSPKVRYYAASGFSLLGYFTPSLPMSIVPFAGIDMAVNIRACIYGLDSQEDISETRIKDSSPLDFYLKLNKIVRSPLFLTGIGFAGKGIYDFLNGFVNNEPIQVESYETLSQGLAMINVSSSMFLKDRNPRLLKKEPFWRKAYSWVKEKVDSLEPQPLPSPVPIKAY